METKRIPFQYLVISAKLNHQRLNNLEVKEPTGERPEIQTIPFLLPCTTHIHMHMHTRSHTRACMHAHTCTSTKGREIRKFLASSGNDEMFKFVKNEIRINQSSDETDPQPIFQVPSMASKCPYYFFITPVRNYYLAF